MPARFLPKAPKYLDADTHQHHLDAVAGALLNDAASDAGPPRVGIKAMGVLMDRVLGVLSPNDPKLREKIRAAIAKVKPQCHWTEPTWDSLGGLRAKDLQNTPSSVNLLANLLVRAYAGIGEE